MIRIVGVQRNENIGQEFVLLQNQGNMRLNLRGYTLIAESAIDEPAGLQEAYVIAEDIDIPAGHHAAIRTGSGTSTWCHKHDGYHIYHLFLGRNTPIWARLTGDVHLLAPTHKYSDKQIEKLLVKR